MRINIQPALKPEIRQKLAAVLSEIVAGVGRVDGGGTHMDGTACDIYVLPLEGFSEMDLRIRLTGTAMEPPWPLPVINLDENPEDGKIR